MAEQKVMDKGVYVLEITSVDLMHDALDDDNVWAIMLKDVATGEEVAAYAANNEKNKAAFWGEFEVDFYDMQQIEGRVYMFPVRVATFGDILINVVQAPVHLVSLS